MSRFAQYTIANAPESSKPLLARVHKALGFVPNLFATFAESPAMLEGYLALSGSLDKGALSATERQLVEIAVSTENRCAYCVAAHSTIAGMFKARPGRWIQQGAAARGRGARRPQDARQLHTRADERAARRGVPAAAVGRAGAGGRLATAGRDGRLGAPVCGVVGREDQCTSLSYGAIR